MNNSAESPPPDHRSSSWPTMGEAYLGLVAFGTLNLSALFIVLNFTTSPTLFQAVAFLGVICALAALAYFLLHRRGFAAGLLSGYALMTVASGGTCTLLRQPPMDGTLNPLTGLFLYIVALAVFGSALLISSSFKS